MAREPALLLLALVLLSNNVLPSVANEDVVIANIGEDVLFLDRPLTLRCISRNPQFMSLSWWNDRAKMAEVSGSGDITPNPAFENVTFTYNGNILSMDFAALTLGDSGVYSCTVATINSTESTETVQLEVYTKDQCVASSNGEQEYLVSDIPSILLVKCTYPTLQSRTLDSSWFDATSNLDEILTFSPVSNDHSTSVKALYSVDQERNGTILTCLVGEQAGTLRPSNALFSCSLGPLYFYDHPLVEIDRIYAPTSGGDDSIFGGTGGIDVVSFACRFVPSTLDGKLSWTVSSQFINFTIEYLDGASIISINVSGIEGETELNMTCTAEINGESHSVHRSFNVLIESNLATTTDRLEDNVTMIVELPVVPGDDVEPDGLDSLRVIVIALTVTVVVLVLVLLQILIWCLIQRYDRRRELRILDVKNATSRPNPTADTNSVSGFSNSGFSEPPQYNDIFMTSESRSMSITDRRVEIRDDEEGDGSSDDAVGEELARRFQRQSTVSTFSDTGNYSPVNPRFSRRSTANMFAEGSSYTPGDRLGRQHSCPPSTDREEPAYDSAPSSSIPIYARADKHRTPASAQTLGNGSISSDRSRQRNVSMDGESGISSSEQPLADEIYFELTEGEIESTAC